MDSNEAPCAQVLDLITQHGKPVTEDIEVRGGDVRPKTRVALLEDLRVLAQQSAVAPGEPTQHVIQPTPAQRRSSVDHVSILRRNTHSCTDPRHVIHACGLLIEPNHLLARCKPHMKLNAVAAAALDLRSHESLGLSPTQRVPQPAGGKITARGEVARIEQIGFACRVGSHDGRHALPERQFRRLEVAKAKLPEGPQKHGRSIPPALEPARPHRARAVTLYEALPADRFRSACPATLLVMSTFDVEQLRRDFPILKRMVHGKPLVYLDHAASSQRPQAVLDAMEKHYTQHHANVHRGAHQLSAESTDAYEAARGTVARFLGAPDARSLVFTRNATEGINLLARSWGDTNLRPGDEIIVTVAEHHANLVPWQLAAERNGAVIRAIPLTESHRLDLDAYRSLLSPATRVVAVAHMSNVLGVVHPIREIAELARGVGALTFVDGAQAVPHLPVNLAELGVDAYAISGHKMLGPTGIGALWVRPDILEAMPPFLGGGEMIRKVEIERSTYADIPMRFEAGTPAIAEAVGLAAAVCYLEAVGMQDIWTHDHELGKYALEQFDRLEGVTTFGPRGADRGGIVPFVIDGVHPHDVASALDAEGIAVRAGHHCAQPLMKALGVPSTVRASSYLTTTEAEIDALTAAVASARDFFAAIA